MKIKTLSIFNYKDSLTIIAKDLVVRISSVESRTLYLADVYISIADNVYIFNMTIFGSLIIEKIYKEHLQLKLGLHI